MPPWASCRALSQHLAAAGAPRHPSFFPAGRIYGRLFFVLSGFVLTLQYDALLAQPNPAAVKRYALARLARIAPTYWLILLLTLLGYLGAPTPWLGPGVIVALMLASVLLHRQFEEPLRRWLMRSASPSTNTP